MIGTPPLYHRTPLAKRLVDDLQGVDTLSAATSGLFLAAPRRIGKSTFLKIDLIPELKKRSIQPIYVDLWSDRSRDPAELIQKAIRDTIVEHDNVLVKGAKKFAKINVNILGSGFGFDFDKLGKEGGPTIADAIELLHKKLKKPIALIIDEAQGALASASGRDMMFALKAARDRLNVGEAFPGLLLICTGSDRNKLATLLTRKDQPFYGAALAHFPHLDAGYTIQLTKFINRDRRPEKAFEQETLWRAFEIVSHRPEELVRAVQRAMTAASGKTHGETLIWIARASAQEREAELSASFDGLTKIQKVLLLRMLELSDEFVPFDKHAMAFYRREAKSKSIANATIQSALEALAAKNIVWNGGRAKYAIEDSGTWKNWFEKKYPAPSASKTRRYDI